MCKYSGKVYYNVSYTIHDIFINVFSKLVLFFFITGITVSYRRSLKYFVLLLTEPPTMSPISNKTSTVYWCLNLLNLFCPFCFLHRVFWLFYIHLHIPACLQQLSEWAQKFFFLFTFIALNFGDDKTLRYWNFSKVCNQMVPRCNQLVASCN